MMLYDVMNAFDEMFEAVTRNSSSSKASALPTVLEEPRTQELQRLFKAKTFKFMKELNPEIHFELICYILV